MWGGIESGNEATIVGDPLISQHCFCTVCRRVPLLFRKDTKHLRKLFEALKKVNQVAWQRRKVSESWQK